MIGNHIHDTGLTNPQYGEGIYVGTGSYNYTTFPDNCENIWIESNEIHDCGNGEGINVKGECFHVTVRNNTIYDIAPGTSTQYNQSAVTFEGPQNSINNNYRTNESRDLWLEDNEIYNVSGGYSNWDNGTMVSGSGVYVINNTIHDCDDKGFYGSSYGTLGLPIYIYNNNIYSNGQDMYFNSGLTNIQYTNPGANPNSSQTWYGTTSSVSVTGVSLNNSSITLDPSQTSQLTATVSPSNATNKSVSWSSNNTSVATVNSLGLVTGIAAGSATITVRTNDGNYTANCSVTVNAAGPVLDFEGYNVNASTDDGNVPLNTRDSDLGTRWSASGDGQWIKFDMQQTKTVDNLEIAFYNGNARTTSIDIEISTDKSNWTNLYSGSSSGTSLNLETFDFTNTSGRYVRIVGHGNSVNDWNSITEIVINLGTSTIDVTGVSLDKSSVSITEGGTSQLIETVSPLNATDKSVSWSSSNSSVATVNSNGLITTIAAGSATITVTTNDGGFTDNCSVTVNSGQGETFPNIEDFSAEQVPNYAANLLDGNTADDARWSASTFPQWVVIDYGSEKSIVGTKLGTYLSRAYQFIVEASNSPASGFVTIVDRTSNSSASQPITDDFGVVMARYIRITITGASVYTGSWVSITEFEIVEGEGDIEPTSVSLNQSSITLTENNTFQLTETVNPSDATDKSVSWSSSNTSVATVNSSGLVTAQSVGNATITVSTNVGSFTDNCTVTVNASLGYTIYEAEDGSLTGVTVANSIAGYSGTGYIARSSFNDDNDRIIVDVNAPSSGDYTLNIGYQSGSDQRNFVYVNDVLIGDYTSFPVSATFTETADITIPLNSGINTVEVRKYWGYIAVDYFKVMGDGLKSAPLANTQKFEDEIIKLYPNPVVDNSFTIERESMDDATISIISFDGKLVYEENSHQNIIKISNLDIPTGLYIVKIATSGKTKNLKLIVN